MKRLEVSRRQRVNGFPQSQRRRVKYWAESIVRRQCVQRLLMIAAAKVVILRYIYYVIGKQRKLQYFFNMCLDSVLYTVYVYR